MPIIQYNVLTTYILRVTGKQPKYIQIKSQTKPLGTVKMWSTKEFKPSPFKVATK